MAKQAHVIDTLPHKRLIDALILGKYGQAQVNDYLKNNGFPTINEKYYATINNRLRAAFPDHFETPETIDATSIEASGVGDMYAYIFDNRFFKANSPTLDHLDEAFKAYNTPIVRRSLMAMAFAQISEEEIELYSNAKYGDGYATEVYMIFFKYFFDAFMWTYQERKEHMEKETDRDLKRLFRLGLTKDSDFVVWKLGLSPTKSQAEMLEQMTTDAHFNFLENKDINPELAMKWFTMTLKAMEKMKDVEPDDHKATFGDDFRIQLKTVDSASIIKTKDEISIKIPTNDGDTGATPSMEEIKKLIDAK